MNRRSLINPIVILMLLVASAGPTTSARAEPMAPTASTATVTLTAVADAALRSDAPDTPFGSYSVLEIGYALRPAAETVTLVRFDLSSLPFGAVSDYEVEVTLTTMEGTLVAQKTLPFTLGLVTGRITAFSAGPSGFTPGDPIGIALTFVNWSDVAVSGQVRVAIHDAEDTLLQSYSEDFGPLAPDMTVSFSESWTTPTSATGELHVTAAVLFSGTATEPVTITVTPRQLIYLPLVMRQ